MALTVRPISAEEHLAFVSRQRSVSFLQTPAWARVKTEWRSESLGWFRSAGDPTSIVGAGLVLHRPVPRLKRYTLAYLQRHQATKPLGSTWFIKTRRTARQVRDDILALADEDDEIVVIDVTGAEWATTFEDLTTDWMQAQMPLARRAV